MVKKNLLHSLASYLVTNNKIQDFLLYRKVRFLDLLLYVRGLAPWVVRRNVFHLAVQKTGSHYIKAIFNHEIVIRKTGLRSVPGRRYEWTQPKWLFPKGTFVPALFISFWHFKEIKKLHPYKVFAVQRDPRDIAVSWYYSTLETHRNAGSVPYHRKLLKSMSLQEGMRYAIDYNLLKFEFMRSWYTPLEEDILIMRLEDIKSNPKSLLLKLFRHLDVDISEKEISKITSDITIDTLRQKDQARIVFLKRSLDNNNHYRGFSGAWRELWTYETQDYFYQQTGNLIEFLGYEK